MRTPGHPNVLDGAGGGFCDTRRQPNGPAVGNKDSMHRSRGSRSENRPEILRVLDPIERKEKPRLSLLCSIPQDLVFRSIGFGRDQRHHALMICGRDQPVESFTRLNLQGHALDFGKTNDLGKLAMSM